MSTDRTDQYPEVGADDTTLVPPQGAAKSEWPKKIRTLTAAELDRLTIDAMGRFYWDGKLVNYDSHPSRLDRPVDLDQRAMELLDQTARELSDPHAPALAGEPMPAPEPASEPAPEPGAVTELAATPQDSLTPSVPAQPPAPVMDVRRPEVLVHSPAETKRVKFTALQSIGIAFAVIGLLAAAGGLALSSLVAANEWACKVGYVKSYCPPPPEAPKPPARPDIPL
jgi:hypothetical protein